MSVDKLSELLNRLPELLKIPDESGNTPDFVQIGVDELGNWSVNRWNGGEPFDEDYEIGSGDTPLKALTEVFASLNQVAV